MNTPSSVSEIREAVQSAYLADETETVRRLISDANLTEADRSAISEKSAELIRYVRSDPELGIMEVFLSEYGLSTDEGVALMCLAEALLRVPDSLTIDALIQDKIAAGDWGRHLGHSSSSLVNASTWALLLTGQVIAPEKELGLVQSLHSVVRRLGEPVVRTAVAQAMKELGAQFVLGQTIHEAVKRGAENEKKGYVYSYDMLGEAARTEADAKRFHISYSDAITSLSKYCKGSDTRGNPGISVKLSALHPRYEFGNRDAVLDELVPRALSLALLAKSANMGFNIDAEEADRLDLSLDVIEAVLASPGLAGWDGFGVVVQTYGQRASYVVDWLYETANRLDRKIMVRLVKGAYWDTEIKRAQVLGLEGFPVFTRKVNTDVCYISCARKLLNMTDRIYPQFATHNAHTVAAVLHMATDKSAFEFQRLHGMGESLHRGVIEDAGTRCRIYAPVGAHEDLLAYLVRRLLENGANSSFVNQIVDKNVSPEQISKDPLTEVEALGDAIFNPKILSPELIYGAERRGAKGLDITDPVAVAMMDQARDRFKGHQWNANPLIKTKGYVGEAVKRIVNPAIPDDEVGSVFEANSEDVEGALVAATSFAESWDQTPAAIRAGMLERIANLYETNTNEFLALLTREAGKTPLDGISEIREAVDFCRYYAVQCQQLDRDEPGKGRGVFVCISPWNFPLAIFTGQIVAALAAGNTVIAKPAEQTPLIAWRAVQLMHEAGIPREAIQYIPGTGATVGAALVRDSRIAGVCFTGSTVTAQHINRSMAETVSPDAPLIAETGGLNAMIVDSTALPEQAVRDIVISAFQSAGQRCSALRMLYIQKDVEEKVLEMLYGAMEALRLGDPWLLSTDVGPVIDGAAKDGIENYCQDMTARGKLLKELPQPQGFESGHFVTPKIFSVSGIEELNREIFGPILHVATFEARKIDTAVDAINASGYGLTFGLHTRVDDRVERVVERIHAGNVYVNRNQIGAVVGSQPFGGEGLSGTGPKAGGPSYVPRFRQIEEAMGKKKASETRVKASFANIETVIEKMSFRDWGGRTDRISVLSRVLEGFDNDLAIRAHKALAAAASVNSAPVELPGPTGESNRLSQHPRGVFLCLGDFSEFAAETALIQAVQALAAGNGAIIITPKSSELFDAINTAGIPIVIVDGVLSIEAISNLKTFAGICLSATGEELRPYRVALAERDGEILPLVTGLNEPRRYVLERTLCIDTTASGGNAELLAGA